MGKKRTEDAYEVKDVIGYKIEGSKEYFLVWWVGYPKAEATWEPVSNLAEIDGYEDYYKNLKTAYKQSLKRVTRARVEQEQESEEEKESQEQEQSFKIKKVQKVKKQLRSNSKKERKNLVRRVKDSNSEQQIISQSMHEDGSSPPKFLPEPRINPEKARLKQLLKNAPPVHFQIKIKQFKHLPFLGQKISQIKQAFTRNGKTMYQVELAEKRAMTEPVILHQNFIKVLWPKQFATYLLSKQRQ